MFLPPLHLLNALASLRAAQAVAHATASGGPAVEFNWQTIEPSSKLLYHSCYQEYQCARLLLPLDWLNGTDSRTVAIAIVKLPAVVEDNDPAFGGTIFTQPGGPAASGTLYGRKFSHKMQQLVDIPDRKHYEILSFDLRGTGQSEPRINCFPGILGYLRIFQALVTGPMDISPAALALRITAAKADGLQCETVHADFLPYISTANVARDMIGMLDAIQELRQLNTRQHKQKSEEPPSSSRLELRSKDHTMSQINDGARLQYWGISYGTYVGNTFASMFPGRVGRMVLDGVMDADDIVNGVGWLHNTLDTDEIVEKFFQDCFAAGEISCALYRKTDASGFDISRRFWTWARALDEHPLTVTAEDGARFYVRYGDIRDAFLWASYNAVSEFQSLARDLDNAMHADATPLLHRVLDWNGIEPLRNFNYSVDPLIPDDARTAFVCADGEDVTHYNNSDWHGYLQTQLSISSVAGAMWTTLRLQCAGWRTRPNWSFKGPFRTPKPAMPKEKPKSGQPAAPLLFASTLYDPVTPLRNARAMSKGHPGAGVLVQNSTGHCLILGPLGPCAKQAVSTYFDSGVVPLGEVICEPVRSPWVSW